MSVLKVRRSCIISPDERYRYSLSQSWGPPFAWSPEHYMAWVMLNPSTGDATKDDQTLRRCRHFAQMWGYRAMRVVNLYGLRSTDPSVLFEELDPVGPFNNRWITEVMKCTDFVVAGWGAQAPELRVREVLDLAKAQGRTLYCLGTTASGQPRHPLRLANNTQPEVWTRDASLRWLHEQDSSSSADGR